MNKRTRIMAIILVAVLVLGLIAGGIAALIGSAGAVSREEIEALQAEVAALRAEANELAQQKAAVNEEIYRLQGEHSAVVEQKALLDESIRLTQQEIVNISAQIYLLDQKIEEKTEQYEQALAEEEKQTELFRRRVREMEEGGDISYVEILFQASSFAELLSLLDSVTDVMRYDEWVVEQLHAAQAVTLTARQELEDSRAEAEASRQEQVEKQAELEAEMQAADELMAQLESEIEVNEETAAGIQAVYDEADRKINETIAEIQAKEEQLRREEEERRRQEEERRRQEEERRRQEEERQRQERERNSYNSMALGTYIWPSKDSRVVTSPYGSRYHPVLHYWRTHNGIDIGAQYGTYIYAADGGTVVTSEMDSGYGNYVMISHGGGRYTLYGHMSSRLVKVGDTVSQGDIIGLVGSTGLSNGPHIHFEIYVDGVRTDPLNYFSNYIVGW